MSFRDKVVTEFYSKFFNKNFAKQIDKLESMH